MMRIALCAILFAAGVFAQEFEAASVKPSNPSRGIDVVISPGGRLTATNCTLELLIQQAYNIDRYQLTGGPDWITADRYDIIATPPSSSQPPSRAEQRIMLQNLLADRFHLKIRRETKEGTVYALITTSKIKLQPTKNPDDRPLLRTAFDGDHDSPTVSYYLEGRNVSMPLFATKLSGYVHHPVYDETEITGSFDFKFDYAEGNDSMFLFGALQKALGLKLEPRKGSVETLIVDHAEKPSAN
jgi:uncharacterized protein (TIGR03435 family)